MGHNLNNQIILLLGGGGFLGNFVVRELAKTKARLIIASRSAGDDLVLKTQGEVGQITLQNVDVSDFTALEKLIKKSTIVINLIGILHESGKQQTFDRIHAVIPAKIAELCAKHKIQQFIHISALGIEEAAKTARYAKSKLQGEQNVLRHYPQAVVLRPSLIFGERGSNVITLFASIARILPVLPLIGGGKTMLQPVYAGDIALVIRQILSTRTTAASKQIYEVGGKTKMSFKDLLKMILRVLGKKRFLISLPFWYVKCSAFFLEWMPKPLLTRDLVEMLKYDNIVQNVQNDALRKFNIDPTPLEGKLNDILFG